jgi:poly-gamma-glutamate system protein
MSEEARNGLAQSAIDRDISILREADLKRNVEMRMRLYDKHAAGRGLKAFINIGGGRANIGASSSILKLRPGLVRVKDFPPPEDRGVLQKMAFRGIPVIHLLNIRGLALRYGLPWDPQPLPKPGISGIYRRAGKAGAAFNLLAAAYLFAFILFAVHSKRTRNGISARIMTK